MLGEAGAVVLGEAVLLGVDVAVLLGDEDAVALFVAEAVVELFFEDWGTAGSSMKATRSITRIDAPFRLDV